MLYPIPANICFDTLKLLQPRRLLTINELNATIAYRRMRLSLPGTRNPAEGLGSLFSPEIQGFSLAPV
jgi:hypothetical protein